MDKIKIRMRFITITCITGILLDGLLGLDMFLYSFLGISVYIQNQNIPISSSTTQPVMMLGTSLMLGWTVLLIWTLQKPIERKGTLIITAYPVVLLYIVYDIFQYINDISIVNPTATFSVLVVRCCLVILFNIAYIFACQLKNKDKKG